MNSTLQLGNRAYIGTEFIMLVNIYLTVTEPTDGSDPSIKMDTAPSPYRLAPSLGDRRYNYSQIAGESDAQVSGDKPRIYMGIIAQYDSLSAQFTILETLMRGIRINIPLLKECMPIT